MIRLNVEQTNSEERMGEYLFEKNLIYIGNNIDADLYLEDNELNSNHIIIEIVDGQLIAHAGTKTEAFWVDGKITTKFKFLSPGNKIKAGKSVINVVEFSPTKRQTKRELLNKNTDELLKEKNELLDVIKSIRESL